MDTNPFDQFDQASPDATSSSTPANPFDQFDGHPQTVPVPVTTTSDKSLFEQINDAGNNFADAAVQNGLIKPAIAATQLAGHAIGGIANVIAPNSDVAQALASSNATRDQNIHDEEAQYQKDVPTNTASVLGAVGGTVAPFLVPGGAASTLDAIGSKAASFAPESWPILQKIFSGAAQGATVAGLTQPVTSGPQTDANLSSLITGQKPVPSYLSQKLEQVGIGAATGGVIPAIAAGGRGLNALAQNFYAPETVAANNLGRTLQATPETVNALSNYVPKVAGETSTTAQVVATPQAAMVEKAAANNPDFKLGLINQQNNNNAARLATLQSVAGDEPTMTAALKARSDMAKTFNDANLQPGQNPIDPSAIISSLKSLQAGTLRPAIKNGAGDILDSIQGALNPDGKIDAGLLDDLRQNANDYLVRHSANGVVPSQVQASLGPIKQQITQTLGANVPGYADYLANYAKLSQPINDMQLAQKALDSANARRTNTVDAPQLNLSDINSVLRGSNKANYGLSPDAQSKIQALQDSLKSTDAANSITSPGSDINFNAQAQGWLGKQMLGNNLQGTNGPARIAASILGAGIGEHLGGPGTAAAGAAAGAYINKAANFVNNRIMARYNAGLLDPATAKTMLTQYLSQNAAQAPALLRQNPAWQSLLAAPVANKMSKP